MLDRLEQRVLADALCAAEHQRVVDLLVRALHPVREPADDVVGIVAEDLVDVVEPGVGLAGVAGAIVGGRYRLKHVHAVAARSSRRRQIRRSLDQHRLARRPGHLLDGPVLVEPRAGVSSAACSASCRAPACRSHR